MKLDQPNPLDYETRRPGSTAAHPALLVIGSVLVVIGGLAFFIGVAATGLDLRMGYLEGRSIAFVLAGAFICWAGMKLQRDVRRAK